MGQALRIFVGFDSREEIAYEVCRHSILRHASRQVEVAPIRLAEMRAAGLYWRQGDPLASTEFTYTRFLVPHLAGHEGLALFCDCDFLFLADVAELFDLAARDAPHALWCVHHDYRPAEKVKMDNRVQTVYPRKNWSSLMLFDCAHPSHRALTLEAVSSRPGSFLHQMRWLEDEEIGAVPAVWNWLEGWNSVQEPGVVPKVVHYTRGGPWFDNWRHVDFADLWLAERDLLSQAAQLD